VFAVAAFDGRDDGRLANEVSLEDVVRRLGLEVVDGLSAFLFALMAFAMVRQE
jgi:hypothetical protein